MSANRLIVFAVLLAITAAPQTADAADPPQMKGVDIDFPWDDVTFTQPVLVTHANDRSGTVYVVERGGKVFRMPKWSGEAKSARKHLFLDVTSTVAGFRNGQGGLLSIAFHPKYAENRKLYVSSIKALNDPQDPEHKFTLSIDEFLSDGNQARFSRALLAVRKTGPNHGAGHIAFAPDGTLFIAVGDDNDPHTKGAFHKSQDMMSPTGKILRIDVDGRTGRKQYAIPANNPWPNHPRRVLPEIWAYGMRNPWRFCFDPRGRVWTAEPGTSNKIQAPGRTQEWVTQIVRAGNHGWPFFEGKRQLVNLPPTIQKSSLVPSSFAYERVGEGSTAGIGGYFYKGSKIPALRGKYLFCDFGRGQVYSLDLAGTGTNIQGTDWKMLAQLDAISSLGEDEDGEIYICTAEDECMIAVLIPG